MSNTADSIFYHHNYTKVMEDKDAEELAALSEEANCKIAGLLGGLEVMGSLLVDLSNTCLDNAYIPLTPMDGEKLGAFMMEASTMAMSFVHIREEATHRINQLNATE